MSIDDFCDVRILVDRDGDYCASYIPGKGAEAVRRPLQAKNHDQARTAAAKFFGCDVDELPAIEEDDDVG